MTNPLEKLASPSHSKSNLSLTQGRKLTLNTLWNFAGQGLPLVLAVVTIPILINGLGLERFGILTLIWALIGYASLFDFGLGRALTQLVARTLGAGETKQVPRLVVTSLLLMAGLGLFGGTIMVFLAAPLSHDLMNIPPHLQGEVRTALLLIAAALPFVIVTTGLRGVLEAHQRFDLTSSIRLAMGLFSFLGPIAVLSFSANLAHIVIVLVLGRVVTTILHLYLCLYILPSLKSDFGIDKRYIKPLFSFGGWMTVSNIVAPVMLYIDRFVIAGLLSTAAVAYYTTPYDVVTRLWIVPGAILGVLFPAMGLELARDIKRAQHLYYQSLKYIFLLLFPVVLLVTLFAHQGLAMWLGTEFADNSFRIAQLLAVGVLLNSLAQSSASLLQAAGRPDLTAKLHAIEILPYLGYLWVLVSLYGITGAALAWLIRVSISFSVLFFLSFRFLAQRSKLQALRTP